MRSKINALLLQRLEKFLDRVRDVNDRVPPEYHLCTVPRGEKTFRIIIKTEEGK